MKYLIVTLGFIALALMNPIYDNSSQHRINVSATKHVVARKPSVANPAPTSAVPAAAPQPAAQLTSAPTVVEPGGCGSYLNLVEQYNWPVNTMMAIMRAESGCNPLAISATNDFGLMQLHNQEIFDPATNIAHAYNIYAEQGLHAWTTYNDGAYAQFL